MMEGFTPPMSNNTANRIASGSPELFPFKSPSNTLDVLRTLSRVTSQSPFHHFIGPSNSKRPFKTLIKTIAIFMCSPRNYFI
ncbi:hypothetical protein OAL83_00800, partial [bacterium]|nr:hypothetical protein [bacterium]